MPAIAFRIYKRPFNPVDPDAKNIRVLVAQFTRSGEKEAKLLHHHLDKLSTDFKSDNEFSHFRYTLKEEQEPVKNRFADLQIDTTKARPTGRPIRYQLSWEIKHDRCHILAVTKMHGAVRAEIDNEPLERQRFVRMLKQVWPNAEISK